MTKLFQSKITSKGRITIPSLFREEMGLKEGDRLLVQRRGQEIVLVAPADVVDPSAGVLSDYAYTCNPDPAEERRWVAQHIAETADADGW